MNSPARSESPHHHRYPGARAFSLIELLTVITIIGVLGALTVPALDSSKAKNLLNGGNLIAGLVQHARQNAMAKGRPTSLVMVTAGASDRKNKNFVVMEWHEETSSWSPITRWMQLPDGVTVDASQSADFIADAPSLPGALALPLLGGKPVPAAECAYQVFGPDGGLFAPQGKTRSTQVLRVVEEVRAEGHPNYYDIYINGYTGIAKVGRP